MDLLNMLEIEVDGMKKVKSKKNVTSTGMLPSAASIGTSISGEENDFFNMMFGGDIASVRFRKLHCTACDVHIGSAPAKAHTMYEHPVLKTLLCTKCREFYGDGTFEQGEDATDMFCRWCANGGNLYCCSYCSNTFCYKCIRRNFDSLIRKKIEANEKWMCFVCDPKDLYSARAVCRALLQHVQTVTRILQSEQRMTLAEIEEKMNLDESECCPRTRKRKRRKTASNSEEDDETYVPSLEDIPLSMRRKARRSLANSKARLANGTVNSVFSRNSASAVSHLRKEPLEEDDELPLIPCEQSMIECENETINPHQGVAMRPYSGSVKHNNSLVMPSFHYRQNPGTTNSISISAIPTANLLRQQPKTLATSFRKKNNKSHLSPYSNSTPSRSLISTTTEFTPMSFKLQPQSRRLNTPMVAIPPRNTIPIKRARVILPKPINQPAYVADTHVIELNSDSDESTVKTSDQCNIDHNHKAAEAPSTLTSMHNKIGNNHGIASKACGLKNDLERQARQNNGWKDDIRKVIFAQGQEVDTALVTLKKKLSKLFLDSDASKESALRTARLRTKHFHQAIYKTISRLSEISDNMVREYNTWRQSQLSESDVAQTVKAVERMQSTEIPLDMTCVRDSDSTGSDNSDEESENLVITSLTEGIKSIGMKSTVDRGVGDSSVSMVDQSTQAYDVLSRDYEKCIGYSLLMKADYDPKTENEVLKPVMIPSEYFGKYEEEYIFYLQHIEDHGIETEEIKDLADSNETPLKDLIETDSSFISETLENVSLPVTNGVCEHSDSRALGESDDNQNTNIIRHDKSPNCGMTILTTNVVEELAKMVTKLSDDLKARDGTTIKCEDVESKDVDGENKRESRRKQILNVKDEETMIAVRTLINDDEWGSTNSSTLEEANVIFHDSDEECTIID